MNGTNADIPDDDDDEDYIGGTVGEMAAAPDEDEDSCVGDDDAAAAAEEQICCLVDDGRKCKRPAGNACYSKKIQRTVQQRKLKLDVDDTEQHTYICDHHKAVIQSVRQIKRKRHSDDEESSPELPVRRKTDVDFSVVPLSVLKRYKAHYKLPARPGMNKAQLLEVVSKHFKTIRVDEKEILTFFIYMSKSRKSRHDQDLNSTRDAQFSVQPSSPRSSRHSD